MAGSTSGIGGRVRQVRISRKTRRAVWAWEACRALGIAAACLAAGGAVADARQAGPLRAGTARVDITPTQPVQMSGYGSRKELSQGIHDPLSARVLAFEQGGKRLVLLSCDLIGWYGEAGENIRKSLIEACGLQPSELFLSAIHTHGGPSLAVDPARGHANNVEYTKALESKLAEAVKEALSKLAPVQIGFGSGASPVGVNRREAVVGKDGKTRMQLGRNPAGPRDPEVQVLKVWPADGGGPAAVAFAYACHSTSLGPRNLLITGDLHGMAEQFIEKYLGGAAIAPAFAGASGDIDPWVRVLPRFETDKGWIPEPVLMSTMLAEEVLVVADRIRAGRTDAPIVTAMKRVELPGKPRERAGQTPEEAAPVPLVITAARLGDVAFVGLGAEVFNEIGRAIKSGSPFPHTVIITHCNGAAGYIPTRSAYADGGYEVQTSRVAPGAAEQVIEEALRMLRELK